MEEENIPIKHKQSKRTSLAADRAKGIIQHPRKKLHKSKKGQN